MVLAKTLADGGGYYSVMSAQEKGQELFDFLDKHSVKYHEWTDDDISTGHEFDPDYEPFELIYENSEEYTKPFVRKV